jgi:hypothetical protein
LFGFVDCRIRNSPGYRVEQDRRSLDETNVKENIMRATIAVSSVWRAYALAFGLGLAFLGMGVGLAHAQSIDPSGPSQIASPQIAPVQLAQGLLPPVPDNSFLCRATPGGWCDLRDWRGFGRATVN